MDRKCNPCNTFNSRISTESNNIVYIVWYDCNFNFIYYRLFYPMTTKSKSGRKPVTDPKVQLCIYVEQSVIDKLGGADKVREVCYNQLKVFKS